MKAATEMPWKKRCSYKQLFWKLLKGKFSVKIYGKYLWSSSFLVKFLHYLVPGSFYLRKKPAKKHSFHKFLYKVNTSGNATESCNFTKTELLGRYFSMILTANFKIPILQNTS